MASGRIQPGSRQWVEAMRRLSGTEDTTVDMSMGRKVSRDAAIPHGMGTAALDTRLRGAGAELPALDADVRAIVEGLGFVFDPSDFATLLNGAGGPVTGPAPISRLTGKWGAGTEQLDFFAPFPSLTAESDLSFPNGVLGFGGFSFRGGDAYCVTLGFKAPEIGETTILYRRERGSGMETLDIFLDDRGTITALIAGADQERESAVIITTSAKVRPGEFFTISVLAKYTENTAEVWLNGVSQGTGTFLSPAGPAANMTQTWVVLYSIDQTLLRRVIEYAGLPTAGERDLFERWVKQDAGIGRPLPEVHLG